MSTKRHKDKRKNNARNKECIVDMSASLPYSQLSGIVIVVYLYRPMALIINVCVVPTSSPFFLIFLFLSFSVNAPMSMVGAYPCSVPEFVARSQDRGTAR